MPQLEYKGVPLEHCSQEQLIECITLMVKEVNDSRRRLSLVADALTKGEGFSRLGRKELPPLAVEGRKGMKP